MGGIRGPGAAPGVPPRGGGGVCHPGHFHYTPHFRGPGGVERLTLRASRAPTFPLTLEDVRWPRIKGVTECL